MVFKEKYSAHLSLVQRFRFGWFSKQYDESQQLNVHDFSVGLHQISILDLCNKYLQTITNQS